MSKARTALDGEGQGGGGRKNLLINGNKTINQRGFNGSWSSKSTGAYGYDRWKKHASGIEQVIEGGWFGTGTYCLSWNGSGSGRINGSVVENGGTFEVTNSAQNISVVVPSAATEIQVALGHSATDFEHTHIGSELALCQRYYQHYPGYFYATVGANYLDVTPQYAFHIRREFPPMRVIPTVSFEVTGSGVNHSSVFRVTQVELSSVGIRNTLGAYTGAPDVYVGWTLDAEL